MINNRLSTTVKAALIFGAFGPALIGIISVPVLAVATVAESAITGQALPAEFAKACLVLLILAPFQAYTNGGFFIAPTLTGIVAGYCRRYSQSKLYVPLLACLGATLTVVIHHLLNTITWNLVAHPTVRFVVNNFVNLVLPSGFSIAFLALSLRLLDARAANVISTS